VSEASEEVLQLLNRVQTERKRRSQNPEFADRVDAVKRFQHERFQSTYRDLLTAKDTSAATRFFLDELYGPKDFSARDFQFARVVPIMAKLMPRELMDMVLTLARLHALSEELDTEMGMALKSAHINHEIYREAWREVGQVSARHQQIIWMVRIGSDLKGHTQSRGLRTSLRLMRGPAVAAGLGTLQSFLETGLDAFTQLRDSPGFLATIAAREEILASEYFAKN